MKQNSLSYEGRIIGRFILLLLAVFLVNVSAFAQDRKVTGKISNATNSEPVVGATVTAKKSRVAVQTNADGVFSITVPTGETTLTISSVGYETQDVLIGAGADISISIKPAINDLNEIVVIGYGTQKRKDVTGAVSSVSATQIEKFPITNAGQALQGRAAGVQVINNDGAPGGGISVLIRGIGSLAGGGNDPLYVVDGYPILGGINNINPNDIATIDILKDASATAVYGIRAANGIVMITTKKGLRNKTQISVDAYTSSQSRPKFYDLLNAQQFGTLSNDVEANDATGTYHGLPIWKTPNVLHNVDWQDAMYRTGLTQNYSVAIRGGNDKVQAATSLGYFDQKGIVLGSFYKRFSASLNLDYQPTSWLKSSTSLKYSNQNSNNPFGSGNLFQLVVNPPTLDSGNRKTFQIKDGAGNYGFFNPINPNVFKFSNPVYTVESNEYKNVSNNLLASSFLEATVLKGLRIKSNAGINVSFFNGSYFQPEDGRANAQFPAAIIAKAFYSQNTNNTFEWLWENTIAYDKTFGKHTINFVGGISAQKNTYTRMSGNGIPPNNTIRDLSKVTNLILDAGNGTQISTLASQFGRINYNFDDKYLITGTVRRDGSSKFTADNQYAVFPSGAVAWRVSNEEFMKSVAWVSDVKLRGSYGKLGNQTTIGLFQYQALFAGNFASNVNGSQDNFGYPFNKLYQNGYGQVQPANPGLKWETDIQTDIGLDASFLHGNLTLTFDWFNRDSKDFLLTLAASPQTGYNAITRNVGSMNNKGIEIALNYRGSAGKDFNYNIGLTASHVKNTLTSITSGTNTVINFGGLTLNGQGWGEFSHSDVGGTLGEFFGYKSLGIFQTQAQIDALNAKAPGGIYYRAATKPGDRYFADINGDNIVNANDRTAIGNPQPKVYGGLNFDATYKSWDFNLYFYGSFGNKVLNWNESNLESFQKRGSEGVENVSINYYNNRWTPTNPSNRYSRALANDDNTLNNVPSDVWVENGSFVKLKNLSVGYTLPAALTNRYNISRLRLYVSTQNLFTITKYSGLDPEIGIINGNATQNGIDNGTYPSSRFYTFGLNVTF